MSKKKHSSVGVCLALLGLSGVAACSDAEQPSSEEYLLTVHAEDDSGAPLGGVRLESHGKASPPTDSLGNLRTKINGWEGEEKSFQVLCPPGYRSNKKATRLRLRTLRALGASSPSKVVEHELRCHPTHRKVVVAIRTEGLSSAPVLGVVEGSQARILTHTKQIRGGPQSVAHAVMLATPESTLGIRIDTSSFPRIIPQHPVAHFDVGNKDAFFVLEQSFKRASRKKSKRARRPKYSRPSRLPVRIR